MHQPIRSALGERARIDGKPLLVYQLGCKSGSGAKGFADRWMEEARVDRATVDAILDENMCCYALRAE